MSEIHRKNAGEIIEDVQINKETGQVIRRYVFEGKPCPVVQLTSKIAEQYAGYCLIGVDLDDAKTWLQEAFKLIPENRDTSNAPDDNKLDAWYLSSTNRNTFRLVKGLWFAALVIYCKCFAQTEGRRVKLEKANLPEKLRAYHDHIIELRNTIVAHAGKTTFETSAVNLVLHPDPKSGHYRIKESTSRLDFKDDRDDPVNFAQLIAAAEYYTRNKRRELEMVIEERELRDRPWSEWYEDAATIGATTAKSTLTSSPKRRKRR